MKSQPKSLTQIRTTFPIVPSDREGTQCLSVLRVLQRLHFVWCHMSSQAINLLIRKSAAAELCSLHIAKQYSALWRSHIVNYRCLAEGPPLSSPARTPAASVRDKIICATQWLKTVQLGTSILYFPRLRL